MDIFQRLVTVFGLGAVELWAAIPAGLALGLHPIATGIASALGAITSGLVVALLGDRARAWLVARHGVPGDGQGHGTIGRIWERYGVAGLGSSHRCSSGHRWGLPWAFSWARPSGASCSG